MSTRATAVILIEHNLDVIAEAEGLLDLGPEGSDAGPLEAILRASPAGAKRTNAPNSAAAAGRAQPAPDFFDKLLD